MRIVCVTTLKSSQACFEQSSHLWLGLLRVSLFRCDFNGCLQNKKQLNKECVMIEFVVVDPKSHFGPAD